MSKSKGNVVTPMALLDEHGSDAVRYWAASGRPGTDTAFDVGQMKIGRRLAIKILNASKFVLDARRRPGRPAAVTEPLDRALLAELADVVARGHRGLRGLQLHPRARADRDVLLVVLRRLRRAGEGPGVRRPRAEALRRRRRPRWRIALSVQLRLFAPFLPFVTEEVWSWWQEGSVHRASWPTARRAAGGGRRRRPGCRRGPARWCCRRCARRSPRRRCRCVPTVATSAVDAVRRECSWRRARSRSRADLHGCGAVASPTLDDVVVRDSLGARGDRGGSSTAGR